ncbi:MAG: rhodanese-like domain-containing protein [bacterium]|nr:rhodanese-like domain-containing protein [bacterium]
MRPLALLTGLALSLLVAGCGDDDKDSGMGPEGVAEFDVIQEGVDAYTGSDMAPTISAQTLWENLNDGDASNDPVIVSVRSSAHYALGHIAGAINIPWREISDPAQLARLSKSDDIVVYCYTGHTGGVATTALNAMGYHATNLKFGIVGWTKDAAVRVAAPFSEATDAHDYPVELISYTGGSFAMAAPDNTTSEDEAEILRAAAESYVADADKAPTISAQAVFENLNDGDASNDPVIVSVRSEAHYALGHIQGAINIPWREIAKVENLTQLPTNKQIVVYCYTGHTGAVATAGLNMLGYNAVNMKWGMGAWTSDPSVRVAAPFSEDTSPDLPTVK